MVDVPLGLIWIDGECQNLRRWNQDVIGSYSILRGGELKVDQTRDTILCNVYIQGDLDAIDEIAREFLFAYGAVLEP